jgi:hypothetical protein
LLQCKVGPLACQQFYQRGNLHSCSWPGLARLKRACGCSDLEENRLPHLQIMQEILEFVNLLVQ